MVQRWSCKICTQGLHEGRNLDVQQNIKRIFSNFLNIIRYFYADCLKRIVKSVSPSPIFRASNLDSERLQVLIVRNVCIDAFPDDFGALFSILFTPFSILTLNSLRFLFLVR